MFEAKVKVVNKGAFLVDIKIQTTEQGIIHGDREGIYVVHSVPAGTHTVTFEVPDDHVAFVDVEGDVSNTVIELDDPNTTEWTVLANGTICNPDIRKRKGI